MLLRTVISVNQLSIHGFLEDRCKKWDKQSSEDSAPSSEVSESSGTLYAKDRLEMETEQTLIPICPQHQQRQRQNQQFEGGENFDYYVDRKTGWRYHREPR